MRVVMWCDMEGVSGIVKWAQVNATSSQYEEGRRLYTGDINAAVRGAKRAGAKEIIVVDGHGAGGDHTFNSFIKDQLEPGAEYVLGYRWGSYVEPLVSGCDAMLLPGAHAMAGTPDGILCHTMSSESWYNAYINGVKVGESGLVAAIAGTFNVPVVFVSGDAATVKEVQDLVGKNCVGATVKRSLNRYAARCLAPADAQQLIEDKVYEALTNRKKWPKPYKVKSPVELKVELNTPDKTKDFVQKRGCEILGPRLVVSRGKNFWQVWDQFWHP
ncbi:MAG: M55 family metallopeptidase [Candidatus Sumerlaeaceae bacterium]|nr:M55 family metallopeptidase [Candidatus Sumerlaeaceae bacterium]